MSLRLYRSLQEHLWDMVPVGLFRVTAELNGNFVSANTFACRFLGQEHFSDLAGVDVTSFVMDEGAYRSAFNRLMAEGRLNQQALQIRRPDGSTAWIAITAELLRDEAGHPLYIDGVFFDVTEHHRTVSELHRSRAIFEALGRLSDLGFYICDTQGYPIYSNKTCYDILGFAVEQDRDSAHWRRVSHPDDCERVIVEWGRCVRERRSADMLYRLRGPGDSTRLVRARLAPFFGTDGEPDGWVGTVELVPGLGTE